MENERQNCRRFLLRSEHLTWKEKPVVNLFKIQNDLIADRTSEAWYRIPDNGPYFRYRWQYGTGPDGNFSYIEGEHRNQAVCKEQPSLTMAWGLEVDGWDDRDER